MSDTSPEPEQQDDVRDQDARDEESSETLSEDEYALGRTSDPDGAEREEPAGEDYAGSGF